MKRKLPRFLRSETIRHSRLGKGRRKLQKWRKPRGKHNKTRLKRFSYPVQPGAGFKTQRKIAGKILDLKPLLVSNLSELQKASHKENIVILARTLGARKKIEIIKKAQELGIRILNLGGKK